MNKSECPVCKGTGKENPSAGVQYPCPNCSAENVGSKTVKRASWNILGVLTAIGIIAIFILEVIK